MGYPSGVTRDLAILKYHIFKEAGVMPVGLGGSLEGQEREMAAEP